MNLCEHVHLLAQYSVCAYESMNDPTVPALCLAIMHSHAQPMAGYSHFLPHFPFPVFQLINLIKKIIFIQIVNENSISEWKTV